MKNWQITGLCAMLILGFLLFSGCTSPESAGTAPVTTPTQQIVDEPTPTIVPATTPASGPETTQIQTPGDPIIDSWLNGMVFNADGTVGSDGYTTWKINKNEKNSYFVIANVPPEGANRQRSVSSTEWIYNPFSDKINIRGSSQTFARGIPATPEPTPSPLPADTPVPTPTTPVTIVTEDTPGSLSILTGGGLGNDVTVFIAREGATLQPINTDPYLNIAEDQNPGYIQVRILPNGETSTVSLAPGNYIAYLPSKTAGQPEELAFTINARCTTVISFSAYSYRASSGGGCGG
jgi:hypothetical protein